MPHLRVPIGGDGPVIDLGVWIDRAEAHAMSAQGATIPPAQTIRALIDTGADISAVHPLVLSQLGVPATGTARIRRPSTSRSYQNVSLFDTRLGFGGASAGVVWVSLSTVGVVPSTPGVLAIVGRDMLRNCLFLYDGFRAELLLTY
jgi:hypothetical protein